MDGTFLTDADGVDAYGRVKGSGYETKKAIKAKKIIAEHSKSFGGTLDDTECMRLTGLARNTYYKYKGELRDGK